MRSGAMRLGGQRARTGRAGSVLVVVWLVVGLLAAAQRHYLTDRSTGCAHLGTVVLTVIAGPLNYLGVNPRTSCRGLHLPQPSR